MSAEDEEQLALEQVHWDEGFRQNILNAEWPTIVAPSVPIPYTSIAPLTPNLIDESMGISVFTPLPPQEYPPMAGHVLRSNDSVTTHSAAASVVPTTAHDTALRFQSQIAQAFPWPEEYLKSSHFDSSHEYGYLPATSSSTTVEMRVETLPVTSMQGTDLSYTTHRTSNPWEVVPISQPPSHARTRPSGPERSRRSISQRVDPRATPSGGRGRHAKRAAACWRCRKYRKPCDDEMICSSCQVGNFRVWPPALGCRRDNLEGFALAIIPSSTEYLLRTLPSELAPIPSWRLSVLNKSLASEDLFNNPTSRDWSSLAVKVHATGLFDMELVDLLNIMNKYQRCQKAKIPVLEATCTLFSASCDYYNIFVVSAGNENVCPSKESIAATIQEIRTSMARSLSLFLSLCVSSKRADWFPSVLSFAIFVASVAMFMDAAVAMPAVARTELWDDVTSFCLGLRAQLYPTALDLLRIRANNDKQMAPLKLNCWNWIQKRPAGINIPIAPASTIPEVALRSNPTAGGRIEPSGGSTLRSIPLPDDQPTLPCEQPADKTPQPPEFVRNPEGMQLVGNDEAAFDGFAALQLWLNANEDVLKQGKILFSNDPFTSPAVAAVCTLAPIFGLR